ncbi:MAG: ribokinase family sugar kinase [Parcubacteria group bacterium Athens0714_24]|nr:MAG: ribokinase family sugar kinase [Parcubacteria group bacterium Athens0714_24]
MMYDVLVIGSATRDGFFKSEDFKTRESKNSSTGKEMFLPLGAKIAIPDVVFTTGGGGTNASVTFARQGFKTACISRVGDDISGGEVKKEMVREVITDLIQVDEKYKTAYSVILSTPEGERTILEYRGASDYLSEKGIDWQNLKSQWLYLDSLADNENLLAEALMWAKENGVKVAYNPGKKEIAWGNGLHKYLNDVDIFIVNEDEAAAVLEIKYEKEKETEIFDELDKIVKGIVVMSKGPRGVAVSDGKKIYTAGVPDSPVVERTGAGDAFGSGFVSGYIESGGNVEHAIQLGTANATSVVLYFGAKKGILKKGDWGKYDKVEVKYGSTI